MAMSPRLPGDWACTDGVCSASSLGSARRLGVGVRPRGTISSGAASAAVDARMATLTRGMAVVGEEPNHNFPETSVSLPPQKVNSISIRKKLGMPPEYEIFTLKATRSLLLGLTILLGAAIFIGGFDPKGIEAVTDLLRPCRHEFVKKTTRYVVEHT